MIACNKNAAYRLNAAGDHIAIVDDNGQDSWFAIWGESGARLVRLALADGQIKKSELTQGTWD